MILSYHRIIILFLSFQPQTAKVIAGAKTDKDSKKKK